MTNVSAEVLNYFKLDLLTARSRVPLCQLFKSRYSLYNNGQVWNDSPAFGNTYLTSITVKGKNKTLSLTPVQKTYVSNGNSNEWDVTMLIALLLFIDRPSTLSTSEIQELDQEDKLLKQIKEIRNELAHNANKSVNDVQFNKLWTDLATILVALGESDIELDKLKDDSVFESPKQPINEANMNEALRLNSLGTQAHKAEKYSEAITFFTKATVLAGVSDHDRAIFYSNMSASRLSLYKQGPKLFDMFELIDLKDERYRALKDAKQARNLWSTWWKAHFRVGKVYASLDEHEKAINSFERAFALDPTKSDQIQKELDESRIIFNRQSREEYIDPKMYWKPIHQMLNEQRQKIDRDPEIARKYYSLIEETDSPEANVWKGHKYALGDIDVKQDYEQAAKYFAKAASQGNAEGMYSLARLHDCGLGVKKDHNLTLKLLEQAAEQPPEHPLHKDFPNVGVAEAEHDLGVRYFEGITVRKDLSVAAYWYQRATDHGSALAANKLGSMYLDGLAVDKDLDKADQLLELAAIRGDPLAMLTLAEIRLNKNNFQMAKIWYDRACEGGNVVAQQNRDAFTKKLEARQQYSSIELDAIKTANNNINSLQAKISPSVASECSYMKDYDTLKKCANRGSIIAKQLCAALDHFAKALNMLLHYDSFTKEQEEIFIHELSQCYRIETIVAQIPCPMHKRVTEVITRVLDRCTKESNSVASQIDEDVRLCYATLHLNSDQLIDEFLGPCKQKYPKSMHFFLISGVANGFLRRSEHGLYNINCGLEIEPGNYELLYHRAVLLRHIGQDMDEAIKAYQTFLRVAPKDHRKIPEAYYEMAICYLQSFTANMASSLPTECADLAELAEWTERTAPIVKQHLDKKKDVALNSAKKLYEEGKQAEKLQLSCFLPYKSDNIAFLKLMFDVMECCQNTETAPVHTRKQRLTDPHRVEVIIKHRAWESTTLLEKNNPRCAVISTTFKPRVKQQIAKSLIGLKQITLKEMNPRKDQVYKGYVLSVTVIEETYSWTPSIHLVIEDENFDCERMLVYGVPDEQGEYLISKTYTIGSKMHIINPYLRVGQDMKPAIRVDDFSSIVMQSDSERILNMCRYCCEPNASKFCGKCQQAPYCSKECQTMDWKSYKHKLICKEK